MPSCDAATLQRRLYDPHRVEVPVIEWNDRQLARVSIQGCSTLKDAGALVTALAELRPSVS